MNTDNTLDTAIRATDLRQLGVKYGPQTVETVECLAYDHPRGQVTGVNLQSTRNDVRRQVAFESLDLSKMAEGELRLEPPVLSGEAAPGREPIDTLTMTLPSGASAYVSDGLINPQSGQIMAYEVSLNPQRDGEPIRVMPDEISYRGKQMLASPAVEARLHRAQG